MAETFEAYRTRVLSYLGDEEPIGVQQATPSQLDRRLRDVAPEELIRRPAPEKWSIAEIVAHLADTELAIAKHAGESGRRLNVVGSGRMGRALGLRAARCKPFGGGLSGAAREQPTTVGVGPARTVGGVLRDPRGTRTANGRGVRPFGSGTRLELPLADRPHLGWAHDRAVVMAREYRRTSCCSRRLMSARCCRWRALMKSAAGDSVVLQLPGGTEHLTVLKVCYERISVEPFREPPGSEASAKRLPRRRSPDRRRDETAQVVKERRP
jgi:hypothetical protein